MARRPTAGLALGSKRKLVDSDDDEDDDFDFNFGSKAKDSKKDNK